MAIIAIVFMLFDLAALIYGLGQSNSYKIACAPSEDSYQPARMRRQTILFAVRLKTYLIIG